MDTAQMLSIDNGSHATLADNCSPSGEANALAMNFLHAVGSPHPKVLERSDGTTTTHIVQHIYEIYEMLVKLIEAQQEGRREGVLVFKKLLGIWVGQCVSFGSFCT